MWFYFNSQAHHQHIKYYVVQRQEAYIKIIAMLCNPSVFEVSFLPMLLPSIVFNLLSLSSHFSALDCLCDSETLLRPSQSGKSREREKQITTGNRETEQKRSKIGNVNLQVLKLPDKKYGNVNGILHAISVILNFPSFFFFFSKSPLSEQLEQVTPGTDEHCAPLQIHEPRM